MKGEEIRGEIVLSLSKNINIDIFELLINELYRIYAHNNHDKGIEWLIDTGLYFWENNNEENWSSRTIFRWDDEK